MTRTLPRAAGLLLLASLVVCAGCTPPPQATAAPTVFHEEAFWQELPLPQDAETLPAGEGFDMAFATTLVEPALFDFYANWLTEQGWSQQAPTEAMITLPHQRWRKDGVELLIELQPPDEKGRTVAWLEARLLE